MHLVHRSLSYTLPASTQLLWENPRTYIYCTFFLSFMSCKGIVLVNNQSLCRLLPVRLEDSQMVLCYNIFSSL